MMFGIVGLMSQEGDRDLLERARRWLRPDGRLLLDFDIELAANGDSGSMEVDGGVYQWTWTSDPATRYNHLLPEFEASDGTIYEMHDPYEPERGDHKGLLRYIYSIDELTGMLEDIGFTAAQVPHYLSYVLHDLEDDSYMLLCSMGG